jgi:predicted N-formylglutamate amidohydrolase
MHVLLTCEHGGNVVPRPFAGLFDPDVLETHAAYDLGALGVAKVLAAELDAPLLYSTVTRLLVDPNRSLHNPRVFSKPVRAVPAETRTRIEAAYYTPHRSRIERHVVEHRGRVLHLAVHSFAPRLNGAVRDAEIGLLYDPKRSAERALCERWQAGLVASSPAVRVRRNYPYRGDTDGLTTSLRRRFGVRYLGIEVELNQAELTTSRARRGMARLLASTLATVTASG